MNTEPTATVDSLLKEAITAIGGESPRLDAELLLAHASGLTRTSFRAWPEREVPAQASKHFRELVARRAQGQPVAYLLGEQEFWSLPLQVNETTLIPRPDTECLVEVALSLPLPEQASVLDLGTGTGAIALALASEQPNWRIVASDRVAGAVELARRNSEALKLPVTVLESDWFSQIPRQRFDLIISNPPYIADNDHHLNEGDVRFEPSSALVSGADGLDDIRFLITQAPGWLADDGWLMLEHGYDQGAAVRALLASDGWRTIETRQDYGGNDRLTLAQNPLGLSGQEAAHAE